MNEGRIEKSTKSAFYGTAKQISNIVLSFILKTVFIFAMGKEFLGINAVFKEIIAVFAVADLGIGSVLVYSMYKPLANGDIKKISALLRFYHKIYCYIALIIGIIGLMVLPFINDVINLNKPVPYLHIYYLLYLLSTIASYLTVYRTSILIANQEAWQVYRVNMIVYIIGIILQIILICTTKSYSLYLIIQIGIPSITNYYCGRIAKKRYPDMWNMKERLSKEEEKEIFCNVKSMMVYKISYTLVNSTDNTLISMLVGTVTAGIYSNYLMLINAVISIINVVFESITASIGNLLYTEDIAHSDRVFKDLQTVSLITAFVTCVGYGVLMEEVLVIWLGKEYLLPDGCVYWIVANMYFSCIMRPIWGFRNAAGIFDKIKWVMPMYALLNIILSIVLACGVGVVGIFIATVLSGCVTIFLKEPNLVYDMFLKSDVKEFYKNIFINLIAVVLSIIIFNKVFLYVKFVGLIALLIKTVVVGIYIFFAVAVMYGRKPITKKLLKRIFRKYM